MALAVIMLQGGMREVMQAQGSVWELKLMELVTTIVGGGLLGGCVAGCLGAPALDVSLELLDPDVVRCVAVHSWFNHPDRPMRVLLRGLRDGRLG